MTNLSKSLLMTALLTGILTSSNSFAAETDINEFSLDPMVVTATRTLKDMKEVPAGVSVITAQEIANKNVSNLNEAMEMIPGMMMGQSEYYDPAEKMQLRGFGSAGILVLVDGVQQNNTYNGTAYINNIPVESVERIEVLRGAASSIYGGHAVGGVINIITKEAKEKSSDMSASVSYGSNATWKKSLNINARATDKVSFGLGYEDRRTHGYEGYYVTGAKTTGTGTYNANLKQLSDGKYVLGSRGRKKAENTSYTSFVKYDFDQSKSLKYSFQEAESSWHHNNPNSYVKDADGKPVFYGKVTTQSGDVVSLKAKDFYGARNFYTKDTHSLIYKDTDNNFSASMSFVNNKKYGYTSASVPANYPGKDYEGTGEYSDHPGKIYNFNLEKAWDKIADKHTIVAGMDIKQENMEQRRHNLSSWKDEHSKTGQFALDSGKIKNYAIYLQDEYKLSDPVSLYVGTRLDHYEKGTGSFYNTNAGMNETSPSEKYNELSPKVALSYKADDKTNYFVSYGHSFNPPSMYRIYRYYEYSSYWYVPNPELDPETSDTFEIGMKKKLSSKTNMGANLFYVKTKDAIVASGIIPGQTFMGKNVKKYINIAEEERKGVELEFNHEFSKKYSAYANYTWQEGLYKNSGTEEHNFEIPKHIFHLGVNYKCKPWNAYVDCEYVSECQAPDSTSGEYGSYDKYFIVNTGVNYQVSKGVTVQFKISNLFDKEFYAKEMTPGRTYTLGLRYTF